MTGPGVEYASRAMTLATSGPSAHVFTSLPPSSQEAERRTESRTRRTGSRWALRVHVVGGPIGADAPLAPPPVTVRPATVRHDRGVPGVSRLTGGSADDPEHQVIEDLQRVAGPLPEQPAAGPTAPRDPMASRPSITVPQVPADVVRVVPDRQAVPVSPEAGSSRPQHHRTAAPVAITEPVPTATAEEPSGDDGPAAPPRPHRVLPD